MKKLLLFFFIFTFIANKQLIAITTDFKTNANTAIVIEATTGKVLFNKDGNKRIYPASLTKLMTLYIIFDQLKQNRFKLNTEITISEDAYKKGGGRNGSSTMFLLPNQKVTVEDLIHGIATVPGNDASIAMAEAIAGSESQFAHYMNAYARKLGLYNSHFINSTGWPNPNNYTTAHDIAILSQHLINDFPEYYNFFNVHEFTFNKITQPNRNSLLFDKSILVDGLKTGHTTEAGFNLAFSATNLQGVRIIGVIDGLKSNNERTQEGKKLLTWVFFNLGIKTLYKKGDLITTLPIWNGDLSSLKLYAPTDINVFYNKSNSNLSDYKVTFTHSNVLIPTIQNGEKVASIKIVNKNNQEDTYTYKLLSNKNIKLAGFITRFFKTPYYLIKKLFL